MKYGACGALILQCSLQFSTVPGFVDHKYMNEGPVVANLYSMFVSVKHCALTLGNGASQRRSKKQDMIWFWRIQVRCSICVVTETTKQPDPSYLS